MIWGCLHFSDSDMAGWSGSAEVARVNRCLGAGGLLASIAAAVTIVSTAPSGPAALSSWDAVRVFFSGVGALVGGLASEVSFDTAWGSVLTPLSSGAGPVLVSIDITPGRAGTG